MGDASVSVILLRGDSRSLPLPDKSVDLIVTSPPYFGLRDYQDNGQSMAGQIGSEETPREYIAALVECTREWARVLKPSGSIFVNLGDKFSQRVQARRSSHQPGIFPGKFPEFGETWKERSANGATRMPHQNIVDDDGTAVAEKSLIGLPWRYALTCTDDLGLILRRDIIWAKQSALPESVADRCATRHEYLFHLTKQPRYFAAVDEIREPHQPQSVARTRRHYDAGHLFSVGTPNTLDPAQFCNPLGKLPGSVWEIASQPLVVPPRLGLDHFAAFPMELPRRCILGWSPSGNCTECGEGRRPVSERVTTRRHNSGRHGPTGLVDPVVTNGSSGRHGKGASTLDVVPDYRITGYACACPEPTAPTRPAIVLDPFGGTGTTSLVADALGRTGISVDLSADYCRLAAWRTTDPAQRARAMQVPKPPPVPDGQASLFEVTA